MAGMGTLGRGQVPEGLRKCCSLGKVFQSLPQGAAPPAVQVSPAQGWGTPSTSTGDVTGPPDCAAKAQALASPSYGWRRRLQSGRGSNGKTDGSVPPWRGGAIGPTPQPPTSSPEALPPLTALAKVLV